MIQRLFQWILVASLMGTGLAMAQAEPSLHEVYATAKAGQLDQAQVMMQQVLVSHPNSGKAHFVQSELLARQGKLPQAREALARAEKLAPGLPFAKPEAVQALRAQLAARNNPPAVSLSPTGQATHQTSPAAPLSWGLPLLLAGGVIGLGYWLFRRRPPAAVPAYDNGQGGSGGLSGPQSFGQPGDANPAYGASPAAGAGLGGKVMGGLATGLAVGAGVVAAEAIGRRLMGDHNTTPQATDHAARDGFQPVATNTDMGGEDFGLRDAGSWDDGGGSADAGGGDWDS